jgi:hypothetical protein
MSIQHIYANKAIGITDLRRSDSELLDNLSEPIAILKRDMVKGYLISTDLMALVADYLDDISLKKVVKQRIENEWDKAIEVDINEL